ncbi:glycosyltransferase family 2 protein [Ichthyobacterium seriolicida]|uniref:Glycosyltransferase n=1 Tax=Ichthyobacterium seriolicida TaxID=242600 RepID=A0A1J1DZH6_9FLAO|nr:glycosyltransferase family 2 protein [Ichthyobacterium seriolicida]BAV95297.1 glycosyltransferase [Ichthyobacterium seriolicida]
MENLNVAIVILNYNGIDLIKKFLPSVIKHSSKQADIYIIDNGSSDCSASFIIDNYPEVKLIKHQHNLGYAKGYNLGLKGITHDIFVLLNSDVEVTQNWLTPIIDAFKLDSKIVAAQPKILDAKSKDKFEYAGAGGGFLDRFAYPFCRGRIFDNVETDKGQYNDHCNILWATGACFFVRSKDFFQHGGFDEDFTAHWEEIDLCWRFYNSKKNISYIGTSTVYHVGSATKLGFNEKKVFLNLRNSLLSIVKNAPLKSLAIIVISRLILDQLLFFKFIFEGNFKNALHVPMAHFSFYKLLFKIYKKRAKHQVDNYYKTNSILLKYYFNI